MRLLTLSLFVLLFQLILLFVFNFIEISAQQISKSTTDFNVYHNQNYSFELMYPSNWTYVEFANQFIDTDLNVIASFISPLDSSNDPFQEFFTIKTKKLEPNNSFSNNINQYLEKLKKSITNINISKVDDISDQSKYLKYSFSPQPGLVINKTEYIFLNNDNEIFHLEFTSNNNDKTFDLIINKIVSYFRIV
ncbi:MAG: hypothetical protein AB7F53_00030 [Nitrososphaeraceae archaeon]